MRVDQTMVERFNAKWEKADNGCWIWTASVAGKGYGQMKIPGTRRQIYAHRLAWLIHRGPLPDDLQVCHRCDAPRCVNPEHLFVGTSGDNHEDMRLKGRHLYGERNNRSKLTDDLVREIHRLRGSGLSQAKLAEMFGVGQMTINRIFRGERWAHIWRESLGRSRPGEQNGNSKLTIDQVRAIRRLQGSGLSQAKIAKLFDVGQMTISRIFRGERWANVSG